MSQTITDVIADWKIEFDRGPDLTADQIRAMHIWVLTSLVDFFPIPDEELNKVIPSFKELLERSRDRE